MTRICAFCGTEAKLTGEHVFGDWLSRIGLNLEPVAHRSGWLNRSPRDLGRTPPFQRTVREVCGPCNHGWMSRLEALVAGPLTPLILGQTGRLTAGDQAAIAGWAHKTALVGMLLSSESDRSRGYGVPVREYRDLYALRDAISPLPYTHFWIGQYNGLGSASSIVVTPVVVSGVELADPESPSAYVMTLVLGKVLLQGVRFTTRGAWLELATMEGWPRIWPAQESVDWPSGDSEDDRAMAHIGRGLNLRAAQPDVRLRPWQPAVDLEDSALVGSDVRLPTPCGEHVVFYPSLLVAEAKCGSFHSFITRCECDKAYLVTTESDGAHFKAEGSAESIIEMYNALPGRELLLEDEWGTFVCKSLTRVMECGA